MDLVHVRLDSINYFYILNTGPSDSRKRTVLSRSIIEIIYPRAHIYFVYSMERGELAEDIYNRRNTLFTYFGFVGVYQTIRREIYSRSKELRMYF